MNNFKYEQLLSHVRMVHLSLTSVAYKYSAIQYILSNQDTVGNIF